MEKLFNETKYQRRSMFLLTAKKRRGILGISRSGYSDGYKQAIRDALDNMKEIEQEFEDPTGGAAIYYPADAVLEIFLNMVLNTSEGPQMSKEWRGVLTVQVDNREGDHLVFTIGGKTFHATGEYIELLRSKAGKVVSFASGDFLNWNPPALANFADIEEHCYIERLEEFGPNKFKVKRGALSHYAESNGDLLSLVDDTMIDSCIAQARQEYAERNTNPDGQTNLHRTPTAT